MTLVHLPAVPLEGARDAQPHRPLGRCTSHRSTHARTSRSSSTPRTRRSCRCSALRGIPVAVHVDGLEWKRGKWGRRGKRLLPLGRAVRACARRTPSSPTRQGIADYYTHEFGVADRADHATARPSSTTPPTDRLARARTRARRLPPRRRPLRAREPRRRDRRGLPPQRRDAAARRRRLRALREPSTPTAIERLAAARPAHPPARRRLRPGAARPALRARAHLRARPLGRRHQPVAAARDGRRHGRRSPTTSSSTARCSATDGVFFRDDAALGRRVDIAELESARATADGSATALQRPCREALRLGCRHRRLRRARRAAPRRIQHPRRRAATAIAAWEPSPARARDRHPRPRQTELPTSTAEGSLKRAS